MIKSELLILGRIIKKYKISKKDIDELNKKYEKAKDYLKSYGPRLAGRLDSELEILPIIGGTSAFKKISICMDDYIKSTIHYGSNKAVPYNLEIIGCWINDMVRGEYNPPHTHHDGTGYSTVLFLKIPEFINDAKDPHKFKDGHLAFTTLNGEGTQYIFPKVGDFYIFQADHQHSVMPFKTKTPYEVRRSMSFNFTATPK